MEDFCRYGVDMVKVTCCRSAAYRLRCPGSSSVDLDAISSYRAHIVDMSSTSSRGGAEHITVTFRCSAHLDPTYKVHVYMYV
jgi:hypothetical protein